MTIFADTSEGLVLSCYVAGAVLWVWCMILAFRFVARKEREKKQPMRLRFTVRDLLWLTLVVTLVAALILVLYLKDFGLQERQNAQIHRLLDQVKDLTESRNYIAAQRDESDDWIRKHRDEIERLKKENEK